MATIEKAPSGIVFSRNPQKIQLTINAYYSTAGQPTKYTLSNDAIPKDYYYIPIPSTGEYLAFECYDATNTSPTPNIPEAYLIKIGTYAPSVAEQIQMNAKILKEYIVSAYQTSPIYFTTRKNLNPIKGSNSIPFRARPGVFLPSEDVFAQIIQEGEPSIINPNLTVSIEVLQNGQKPEEGIQFAMEGKKPEIDISQAIVKEYPLPSNIIGKTRPQKINFIMYEIIDTNLSPVANTLENDFYALPGWADNTIFNDPKGNAKTTYLNNLVKIKASKQTPVFINFHAGASADTNVVFTFFYENGTKTQKTAPISFAQDDIIQIPAGWENMEVQQEPYKYTVALANSNSQVVEIQLEPHNYAEKYFLFYNKYGVPETLRTTGEVDESIETEKETYYIDKNIKQNFRQSLKETTVQSGIKHIREKENIVDILNTETAWVWENGEWLTININADQVTIIEESKTTINVEFTYKLSEML